MSHGSWDPRSLRIGTEQASLKKYGKNRFEQGTKTCADASICNILLKKWDVNCHLSKVSDIQLELISILITFSKVEQI